MIDQRVTRETLDNYVTKELFQREAKDLRTFIMQAMGVAIGSCALLLAGAVFLVNMNVTSRFAAIEIEVQSVRAQLQAITTRLDAVEARIQALEGRLQALEARVQGLEVSMNAKFEIVFSKIGIIQGRLEKIESRLDKIDTQAPATRPASRSGRP